MADAPPEQGSGRPTPEGGPPAPYFVTARKYRPQTFSDMVGQEHVARTLQNAIRLGRLAHAYLFSGPRGVGKTTAARILAKAVNCETPLKEREGAEPCRACDSCRAFEGGRALNVIEVDAASNRRIDDIRELRETVRIPPQGAKKKVYILDEVHMLTTEAWNALLKTLEEPPPHVLFVFATTEPHKVLPTILSRTQRFDFRRIAVPEIVGRLRTICTSEGVGADDEALLLLARKGDGALRDALSLFDQAVALCGTPLDGAALREALGVVETDLFFEATDLVAAHDRAGVLGLVDRLVGRGYDLAEFLGGLAEHLRALLVAAATGQADLIEATDAVRQRYLEAARGWSEPDLLHHLMLVDEAERHFKASREPRLTTELALLKMASLTPAADLERLLDRLGDLGALPQTAPAAPSDQTDTGPEAPPSSPPTGSSENATQPSPTVSEPRLPAPQAPDASPPPPRPPEAPAPSAEDPAEEPRPKPDGEGGEPSFSPRPRRPPEDPAPAASPPAEPAVSDLFPTPALRTRPSRPAEGDGADPAATLTVASPPSSASDEFGISLGRIREVWPQLVEHVKAERVHVGTLLQLAEPHQVARGAVEVAVPDEFGRGLLASEAETFRKALGTLLDDPAPALRFVLRAREAVETTAEADPFERLKQLRQEHPVFRALFERFGAEIVWT